jgi:DNA-binding CsgD family transcriptional regulator
MTRAIERRILRLAAEGYDDGEIGRRFKRRPATISRVRVMAGLSRPPHAAPQPPPILRPLERRVLKWREAGADHAEIGARFLRSAGHISRIEGYAQHKLANSAPTET